MCQIALLLYIVSLLLGLCRENAQILLPSILHRNKVKVTRLKRSQIPVSEVSATMNGMTIRLFEEPGEADELSQPAHVSIVARLFFLAWASMVALVPALAATYSALQVINLFRNLRDAESAGAETILTQLHIFNTPLVIALGVSAFLAFGIALVLAVKPNHRSASVGLPFSIGVPILAATPGGFLWFAETTVIDVLSGNPTNTPVAVTAQTISLLLFCALASALFVQAATIVCAIVSLVIPAQKRSDALSPQRVFVWAIAGTVLLAFAGAYFVLV